MHFESSFPMPEFCPVQNSRCVQVLRFPILPALLHGTGAVGVSQTLRRGTRDGITELLQRAPPIFGWAAITLGIGPHSSCPIISKQAYMSTDDPVTNHRTGNASSLAFCPLIHACLKPNSITLAGSKLVAGQLRTCLRPASNQIA